MRERIEGWLGQPGPGRRMGFFLAGLLAVATPVIGATFASADDGGDAPAETLSVIAQGAMVPKHRTDMCVGFGDDRRLELQNCDGSAAQNAELRHVDGEYFELALGADCAHIENYSSRKYAQIVGSDCGLIQDNMLWKPTGKGLVSKLVNYCMTVEENSGHHGARVIQDECGGAWYQRYTIGGVAVGSLTGDTTGTNTTLVVTTAPTTTAPVSTTASPTTTAPTTTAGPPTTAPTTTAGPTTTAPTTTTTAPTTTTAGPTTTVSTTGKQGKPAKAESYRFGLCLSEDDTTRELALQPCDSDEADELTFVAAGSEGTGQVRINGRCVKSMGSKLNDSVSLADCNTSPDNLWTPTDWRWGQQMVTLRNDASGLCLDPVETLEDAALAQSVCNPFDKRDQLWDYAFSDGMMGKDLNRIRPVPAVYHGVLDFNSFHEGTYKMDSWTYGDIAFYAPPGRVTNEMANRWIAWYSHMDSLHRRVWNKDNFDSVYRANDPNHGKKKVVALIDKGKCSCGNKQQAEALGFTDWIVEDPENWMFHWVLFYEMNRGGPTPDFYARTTWPNTHQGGLILPHMMAALAFYEIGGPAGLERDVPGDIVKGLKKWEMEETIPLAQAEIPADHQMGILLTILKEQGTDVFIETLNTMATMPEAVNPTQSLCDFRSLVDKTTGGSYSSRMTNDWRLPTNC